MYAACVSGHFKAQAFLLSSQKHPCISYHLAFRVAVLSPIDPPHGLLEGQRAEGTPAALIRAASARWQSAFRI